MPDHPILSRIRIVLWRPKSPGNVGSVARAMKNMGFDRLVIAEPMRYRDPSFFSLESERMAWGASNLLSTREVHPSIEAAVEGAVMVAGTLPAPRAGPDALSPRVLAPRLVDAARSGEVALLFGQEDIGLTNETLSRCQVTASIPTSDDHPSLNLAQAALIFMYEIRLAARQQGRLPTARSKLGSGSGAEAAAASPPPTQAEIERFFRHLTEALDAIGYLEGDGRASRLRALRRTLHPALRTVRDLRLIEGIVHRIELAAATRPRRRRP